MWAAAEVIAFFLELFWLWVTITVYQEEGPDSPWRWIVAIGNVPAALAYLVVRKVPGPALPALPSSIMRWKLSGKIADARASVQAIGNAYHYCELAKLLEAVGDWDEALEAYRTALSKAPAEIEALWGVAGIETRRDRSGPAREALEKLLKASPEYQSGGAALAYVRLLLKADEFQKAEEALEPALKKFGEPEARYYKARLLLRRDEHGGALKLLEGIVAEFHDSAPAWQDKNLRWMVASEKLIKNVKAHTKGA